MDPENRVEDTPEDSVVPIYQVTPTEEEILEREQLLAAQIEQANLEEAKKVARESALAKLAAIGITQEELSALLGQLGTVYQNGSKT